MSTDRDNPPDELVCRCGQVLSWVWWTPRHERHQHIGPRWVAPRHSPCQHCADRAARLERAMEISRAAVAMGIPPTLRGYTLDRVEYYPGTDYEAWQRAIRSRSLPGTGGRPVIGVSGSNSTAIRALGQWAPLVGGPWCYLSGPVGTGKSTLIAARCQQLLSGVPQEWREGWQGATGWEEELDHPSRPGSRTLVGHTAPGGWLWLSEVELVERQRLSWKGDPLPLFRASRAGVLVLDDLGSAGTAQSVLDCIERLICYRDDHALPTLIASNLAWEEVRGSGDDHRGARYGARVASRLERWCADVVSVSGTSWRRAA